MLDILVGLEEDDEKFWSKYENKHCISAEADKYRDCCILYLLLGLCHEVCRDEPHPHNEEGKSAERNVLGFIEVGRVFEAEDTQDGCHDDQNRLVQQ